VVGEVTHCQMQPFQEEGEEEGVTLQLLGEVEVVEEGQMLQKVEVGYLQYYVRAVIAKLVNLPVKTDNQFGWSL
jgi:hypothetical protein